MPGLISRNKLILSFVILNIAMGTAGGIFQMTLPLYALSLKATTAQIGMIGAASGLGMLLLVIPAGFLVDHYGAKRLFIAGSLASALAAFSLTLVGSPALLIAVTGCQGLFASLKMTSLSASFYRSIKEIGLEKAGWFKGSMSIGLTFIGPVLGGYLARSADFPVIFQCIVALMLVPTGLVYFFHSEAPMTRDGEGLGTLVGQQLHAFRLLLRQRTIRQSLLMEALAAASISTFLPFIVVLLVKEWQLGPTVASTLITLEGAVFIFTVFLCGRLTRRFAPQTVLLASFALSSVGFLGLALAGGLVAVVAATLILGHGLGLINLITSARIGSIDGEKGKVVGLFAAATGLGLACGPFLAGLVGEYFGNHAVFMTFVPLFALVGLHAWLAPGVEAETLEPAPDYS